jgi:hypothetical protein
MAAETLPAEEWISAVFGQREYLAFGKANLIPSFVRRNSIEDRFRTINSRRTNRTNDMAWTALYNRSSRAATTGGGFLLALGFGSLAAGGFWQRLPSAPRTVAAFWYVGGGPDLSKHSSSLSKAMCAMSANFCRRGTEQHHSLRRIGNPKHATVPLTKDDVHALPQPGERLLKTTPPRA